jgi:hypothetical protein
MSLIQDKLFLYLLHAVEFVLVKVTPEYAIDGKTQSGVPVFKQVGK